MEHENHERIREKLQADSDAITNHLRSCTAFASIGEWKASLREATKAAMVLASVCALLRRFGGKDAE